LPTLGIGDPSLTIDLRVAAAHLELNPGSVENAAIVRGLLVALARALPADGGGPRLRAIAQRVDPDVSLPAQAERLTEFFRTCADVMRGRERRSGSSVPDAGALDISSARLRTAP
jgi:hypothetical protein